MSSASGSTFFFFFNDTATTEIYTFPYTTLFRSPPRTRCHESFVSPERPEHVSVDRSPSRGSARDGGACPHRGARPTTLRRASPRLLTDGLERRPLGPGVFLRRGRNAPVPLDDLAVDPLALERGDEPVDRL